MKKVNLLFPMIPDKWEMLVDCQVPSRAVGSGLEGLGPGRLQGLRVVVFRV